MVTWLAQETSCPASVEEVRCVKAWWVSSLVWDALLGDDGFHGSWYSLGKKKKTKRYWVFHIYHEDKFSETNTFIPGLENWFLCACQCQWIGLATALRWEGYYTHCSWEGICDELTRSIVERRKECPDSAVPANCIGTSLNPPSAAKSTGEMQVGDTDQGPTIHFTWPLKLFPHRNLKLMLAVHIYFIIYF